MREQGDKNQERKVTDIIVHRRHPEARHKVKQESREIDKQKNDVEAKVIDFEKSEIERFKKEEIKKHRKLSSKFYWISVLVLLVLSLSFYSAAAFLPWATIKLKIKTANWHYFDSVLVSTKTSSTDSQSRSIPAEVFSEKKNFIFPFKATGKKQLERKAAGEITIYNAYGADAQTLVERTRFESSDKKIFRLNSGLVVPGAKIVNGKISPVSVKAKVTADKPGPEYNIAPGRFTIPGFSGSPKYQGFYAESSEAMAGGFIGEAQYPTDDDIKQGKTQAESEMRQKLTGLLSLEIPKDFKIVDGAGDFKILKESIDEATDENGNFSVLVEAEVKNIGFRESDFLGLMTDLAKNDLGQAGFSPLALKTYKVDYGVARPNFGGGEMSFAPNFDGVFWQILKEDEFTIRILGKNETQLRELIKSYQNIEKINISLWPFWVSNVPNNLNRVKVEVE